MNDPETRKSWNLIKTEPGPDLALFQARFDWLENPRNGQIVKATILEAPDWVNVVALTPGGELVAVRQQRFGTGELTLEIPAGIIEPGEDSAGAAARELLEETGYTSGAWSYLGWVAPNPAYLNNRCHHWLAREARQTAAPAPDEGEDLEVAVLDQAQLKESIRNGLFRHSLAFTALSQVFDLREMLAK